jgi:hypothetical protein
MLIPLVGLVPLRVCTAHEINGGAILSCYRKADWHSNGVRYQRPIQLLRISLLFLELIVMDMTVCLTGTRQGKMHAAAAYLI